ncbi:MAG: response regulator [Caldilineaceae bacterium]|nr:response regulator [Caldilineaceae bacterium]
MVEYAQFQKEIREALYHLYDYERLQELELVKWIELEVATMGVHPLNRLLTKTIEQLKPDPSIPPDTPDWRAYNILFYRFIQCMTVKEVAIQLGIGERHFRRHQVHAIGLLATMLWKKYVEAYVSDHPHGTPQGKEGTQGDFETNLAWLQKEGTLQQVNVGAVMAGVENVLVHLIKVKGTELQIALPSTLPRVRMHPLAMRQILVNVLSYLIEGTSRSCIKITASSQAGRVDLMLTRESSDRNTITAIHEEDPLVITKQLLEMYKGRLDISHPTEDNVIVTIQVPAAQRSPVMIVEDNADTAALFSRYLADSSYRPVVVPNGIEALALLDNVRPNVIILDVMMPGQDGWETLILLKAHPLTEQVPVIVATILTDRELALSLGAVNFLHKPVSQAQLLAALDQAMAIHPLQSD